MIIKDHQVILLTPQPIVFSAVRRKKPYNQMAAGTQPVDIDYTT